MAGKGRPLIALVLLVFLAGYNFSILRQERLLESGQRLVLPLAPLDPRSLLQGDYMILSFALERDIRRALEEQAEQLEEKDLAGSFRPPGRGLAVLRLEDGLGRFIRLHAGEKLQAGEILLEFKYRGNGNFRISSGAYFFEEGLAELYDQARYAELRVAPSGRALIKSLLDQEGETLRKPIPPEASPPQPPAPPER